MMLQKQQRLSKAFQTSLGENIERSLSDPNVSEILVNPCGVVRLDTFNSGLVETDQVMSAGDVEATIRLVASHINENAGRDSPLIAGTIPITGERFQGVLPPITKAPAFSIRKRPEVIFSIDDYLKARSMTDDQVAIVRRAIKARRNIVVSGGTSSGKTTLLNAILAESALVSERIITIEDTRELQCSGSDVMQLLTKRTEPTISTRDLVQTTLRLRPDRIIVGEIRDGGAALEMLKAWNTGHSGGLGTIHANSAVDALYRLEDLLAEVVAHTSQRLIGSAVDLVIQIHRTPQGRRIKELVEIGGHEGGRYLACEPDAGHP